jgi:3-oxoacyl-[acyl-carrier-protein] synthase II
MSDVRVRRAVVTGLGAVTGWGWGVGPFWDGLSSGQSSVRPVTRFDVSRHRTRMAAEVPGPLPAWTATLPKHLSRSDVYAIAAAREALGHAGLDPVLDRDDAGVFLGSSTGGFWESEEFFAGITGPGRIPVRSSLLGSQQCNGPGDAVARDARVAGPVETISSACASGTLALGAALDAIRDGEVVLALVGGADSLCQLTFGGFNALRSVDEKSCRPFQFGRQGLSIGEGAGILVVEELESALGRGAVPLAELLGCGASCDALHMTAPDPQGEGPARAIVAALADARSSRDAVRFINAHGTGTPLNDAAEWEALVRVFGERAGSIPVTATKGAVGHLLGSSGAIEAVATVLSLSRRLVHPTPGGGPVDPAAPVRLVLGAPLEIGPGTAISTSLAFGGSNAAAIFGCPVGV